MKLIGHPCPSRPRSGRGLEGQFSRVHPGVDFTAHEGTSVLAAHQGVVRIGRQEGQGYGLFVRVQGFIDGQPLESLYAHMDSVSVEEGAWVRRGQMIGRVGSSGAVAPHLHFELWWCGARVDPLKYMEVEGDEDSDVG